MGEGSIRHRALISGGVGGGIQYQLYQLYHLRRETFIRNSRHKAFIRSFTVIGIKLITLYSMVFTWRSTLLQALLFLLQGSTSLQSGTPSTASTITTAAPVSLTCSDEDMQAFRADSFVLGKIPECPPPLELC